MHWPELVDAAFGLHGTPEACALWCRRAAGETIAWEEVETSMLQPTAHRLFVALRTDDSSELERASKAMFRENAEGLFDVSVHPWPRARPLGGALPTFDLAASDVRVVFAIRRVLLMLTESARDLLGEVDDSDEELDAILDAAPRQLARDASRVLQMAPLLVQVEGALVPIDHQLAGRFSRARSVLAIAIAATPVLVAEQPRALATALAIAHAAAHDFTSATAVHLGELEDHEIDDLRDMAEDIDEVAAFDERSCTRQIEPLQHRIHRLTPSFSDAIERRERIAILDTLQGLFEVLLDFPDGPEWGHVARPFLEVLHAAIDDAADVLGVDEFDLRSHGMERSLSQLHPA